MFECKICNQHFNSISAVKKHARVHVVNRTCIVCSKQFISDRALFMHCIQKYDDKHLFLAFALFRFRNREIKKMLYNIIRA